MLSAPKHAKNYESQQKVFYVVVTALKQKIAIPTENETFTKIVSSFKLKVVN